MIRGTRNIRQPLYPLGFWKVNLKFIYVYAVHATGT